MQALVDRLAAEQLSVSRIRSVVSAIRALYGYAIERGFVEFSPADGLRRAPGRVTADSQDDEATWNWTDDVDGRPESGPAVAEPQRSRLGPGPRSRRLPAARAAA